MSEPDVYTAPQPSSGEAGGHADYAPLSSPAAVTEGLARAGYISEPSISMAAFLAHRLRKPILAEGPAGVGKTDLARSLAAWLGVPLVRMQCYEGLDEARALYEWKYGKQLLYTQLLKDSLKREGAAPSLEEAFAQLDGVDDLFFSERFLQPRPLLQAMQQSRGSVLLVDEIDKADEAFEAFLLEVLSDYQVTVPEIGTISAQVPPLVILTSNAVRELSDALRRRCLHLFIGFPDPNREGAIVRARVEGVSDVLLAELVAFVQSLRDVDLRKLPSIAETVDFARALVLMGASELGADATREALGLLLKHQGDVEEVTPKLPGLLRAATSN